MSAWVIRGLGMALLHGVALTLLAKYAVYHPTDQTLMTSVALAVLVGAAALWSALDAWRGLVDRGRAWFIAALVAGVVSGILYVIGRAVFVDQTGVSELGGALTGGAAFSALLVLIPAGLGLFVGGRIGRARPADSAEEDDEAAAPSPSPRPRRRVRTADGEGSPARPPRRAADEEPATRPQPAVTDQEPATRPHARVRSAGGELAPRPSPRIRPRSEKPRA
ncbi:B-4DMT family transporter [Amycolatopsis sp. MEPSY49]|uniref:B-4DMT family transporter n=1 Tax=Amycolatopsis sp. MEPSY49 TaxID=3151600 RepID=UPI003F50D975